MIIREASKKNSQNIQCFADKLLNFTLNNVAQKIDIQKAHSNAIFEAIASKITVPDACGHVGEHLVCSTPSNLETKQKVRVKIHL
jgi:hypothetical protein